MSLAALTADQRNQLAERLYGARSNAFAWAHALTNAWDAIRLGAERDESALLTAIEQTRQIDKGIKELEALIDEFDLAELMNGKKSAF